VGTPLRQPRRNPGHRRLALAHGAGRRAQAARLRDVLTAMIKAHEIQGCLALANAFNEVGLDHVLLVKVASTAVIAQMLACRARRFVNALSLAWVDGHPLRTYRQARNAARARAGPPPMPPAGRAPGTDRRHRRDGLSTALTAKDWGFQDALFAASRCASSGRSHSGNAYVMENVLFKVSLPGRVPCQTAVEAALASTRTLPNGASRPPTSGRHDRTHEACLRIIDKAGPLTNPADRDHCIQYMVR